MQETGIRQFTKQDAQATAKIFYDAVHRGSAGHYDQAQRQAWAPGVPALPDWLDRLAAQTTLVAERHGSIVGFMTLDTRGYIDLAFVSPDCMGQGVARLLYSAIEAEALTAGFDRLSTQASHQARRFFERQGWSVVRQQTVSPRGVVLTNFVMEKPLTGGRER